MGIPISQFSMSDFSDNFIITGDKNLLLAYVYY